MIIRIPLWQQIGICLVGYASMFTLMAWAVGVGCV